MKQKLLIFLLFCTAITFSQENERKILRGKVIYRNVNVANVNVINNTTSVGTITNANGQYEIPVKLDDVLIFSSVQYTIKEITITDKILQNNRLVVEVTEKVEELDEVVISPEDQEKFLDFQEEQIVKYKDYQFAPDRYSEVRNEALGQAEFRGANILGLVGLLINSIIGKGKNKRDIEQPIYLRTSFTDVKDRYKTEFYTENLKIPEDKINEFLYYLDDQNPSEDIFSTKNEFQMIDFMVKHSKEFRKKLATKN